MAQKKGIYMIQSNPYQTRSDFQALPSQDKKKRDPHTEYTPESNSIVSKISMEWDPVYIFPSGSSRSIIIPLCRMMLRALGQVNPRNSPYGVVLWILTSYAWVYQLDYQEAMLHVSVFVILWDTAHCTLHSVRSTPAYLIYVMHQTENGKNSET